MILLQSDETLLEQIWGTRRNWLSLRLCYGSAKNQETTPAISKATPQTYSASLSMSARR